MERSNMNPLKRALVGLGTLGLVASCSSTGDPQTRDVVLSDWIQPSPILEQQIDDEAKRMPWTHGFERLEQIRWFAAVGEPAYTQLLELAQDPRDDVAAGALAALGATHDRRLVPYIQELPFPPEKDGSDLELERARTLVRLGDWGSMPILIRGLSDERLFTRSLSLDALKEATRETHGFDPNSAEEDRDKAIKRWRDWWLARTGEGLLD